MVKYLRVGFPGHVCILPDTMYENSVCQLFWFSRSNICVVVAHSGFNWHFLNNQWCSASIVFAICISSLVKWLFNKFFKLSSLFYSFENTLCILGTNSLLDMCLASIFPQFVVYLLFSQHLFRRANVFNVGEIQLIDYFYL